LISASRRDRAGCLKVAGIDDAPEALLTAFAPEGDFSGEFGAKELDEVSTVRAVSGGRATKPTVQSTRVIVTDYILVNKFAGGQVRKPHEYKINRSNEANTISLSRCL
jgi:hypothetical protein